MTTITTTTWRAACVCGWHDDHDAYGTAAGAAVRHSLSSDCSDPSTTVAEAHTITTATRGLTLVRQTKHTDWCSNHLDGAAGGGFGMCQHTIVALGQSGKFRVDITQDDTGAFRIEPYVESGATFTAGSVSRCAAALTKATDFVEDQALPAGTPSGSAIRPHVVAAFASTTFYEAAEAMRSGELTSYPVPDGSGTFVTTIDNMKAWTFARAERG